MPVKIVKVPYVPRKWAEGFHASYKRFLSLILHRRAGKTTAILNHHNRAATDDMWETRRLLHLQPQLRPHEIDELIHPPGGRHYGHVMPTRVQAKMVAWDKLKFYAEPIGGKPNESELMWRFPNGAKVQLFGADDPDSMRGPAFSGLSFDEYSQQPVNIFSEVLSKALGDHLGYAIFAGTIKGKDHLYGTFRAAQNDPRWFSLWQDVDRSLATETGITIQLLRQAMQDDMALVEQGLMSIEEYEQEWYLSLEAAVKGSYYAKQLAEVRKSGRITLVSWDPQFPVFTAWDLGYDDDSAIWWYQNIGNEIRLIDYHCESGGTIEVFLDERHQPGTLTAKVLEKPYSYGKHWLPHDAKAKTLAANGKSVIEQLGKYLGVGKLAIVPDLSVQDGIQAVRGILGRCWFDAMKCEPGLNALLHYKRKYDSKSDSFNAKPSHDWASHPSDSFRMLAVAERKDYDRAKETEPAGKTIQTITLDELWEYEHTRRELDRKI